MKVLISLKGKLLTALSAQIRTLKDDSIEQKIGQVTIVSKEDDRSYSITWFSRMTNVTVGLYKLGKESYVVERRVGTSGDGSYTEKFSSRDAALTYFFANVDTHRIPFDFIKEAKMACADIIKRKENLKKLIIKLKPSERQNSLGRPVLVGENRNKKGILLKIFPGEDKAEVRMDIGDVPGAGRVVKMSTSLLWV